MAKDINFLELLQTFRRGELLQQADGMLNELIEAIRATGGNGTLTLSMPFKTNKARQIECTPKLKAEKMRAAEIARTSSRQLVFKPIPTK